MTVPALPDPAAGERLTDKEFTPDSPCRWEPTTTHYTLQRSQHQPQSQDPSWRAATHGNWKRALALIEARRPEFETEHHKNTAAGTLPRHLRLVHEPLTPYLQWELHLLHLYDTISGGTVRVLPTLFVTADEDTHSRPLPDLRITDAALYLNRYDDHGTPDHYRYTDPTTIRAWQEYTEFLWDCGWPLADYFNEHVKRLAAPRPGTPPPDDHHTTRP